MLVFTKTAGYRHAAIPAAIAAIKTLGGTRGFTVEATEDASTFTPERLTGYRVVIFLLTTGDVLNAAQQAALERYVDGGGGFAGVHSASDTEHDWTWYHDMLGATFKNHPKIQRATVRVDDAAHPSTAGLPKDWTRTDEWYNFKGLRSNDLHALLTVLEGTYTGGTMGARHPIAWCRNPAPSRVWYTAMGHTEATYREPLFLNHLGAGIAWAAGIVAGGCATPA